MVRWHENLSRALGRVLNISHLKHLDMHRHALAACIVGLASLLAGCSLVEGKPKVVQVECRNLNEPEVIEGLAGIQRSLLQFYWSDSTETRRFSEGFCPASLVPIPIAP